MAEHGFNSRAAARDLRGMLKRSRVVDGPAELRAFAHDASFLAQLAPRPPDLAVVAGSTEDVSALMRYASARGIPVTPRGAATGQTAGAVALGGGIVLSLNAMNRVVEVDPATSRRSASRGSSTPASTSGSRRTGWSSRPIRGRAGCAPSAGWPRPTPTACAR
jgi:hypothetical protein